MKEMKKIISLLLCAVMILSVCAACGSAPAATATAAPTGDTGPITVTDQAGSTVEVPRRIDRIAVVGIYPLPSVLTVFFNSAKKIVAMPEQSMLSRAVAGLRGDTLIINLPGSEKAAAENLGAVLDTLDHAMSMKSCSAGSLMGTFSQRSMK